MIGRLRLWICYRLAVRAQQRGIRLVAANPDRQGEADEVWGRLLCGVVDDWQRRDQVLRQPMASIRWPWKRR